MVSRGDRGHNPFERILLLSFCLFVCLFVSHVWPMGLNVLGYQSHLLQRCHPACGHEGYFHLSPVFALYVLIAMQGQHSYNLLNSGWILLIHVLTLSTTEARTQTLVFTRIELTTTALVGVCGYLLNHSRDSGR